MSIRRAVAASSESALSEGLFTTIRDRIDPAWVIEALGKNDLGVRRRKMPAEVVVWMVVGACLFAHMSFTDVMRHLGLTAPTRRGAAQTPPSAGAIAEARARVAGQGIGELMRLCAKRWLEEADTELFYGLRVLAADGMTFRLPDTPSNVDKYGRPAGKEGKPAAWPQARVVCLVDVFTHLVLDAAVGPYRRVEVPLFEEIIPRIPDDTVTVLDRGFRSFAALHQMEAGGTNRHWVLRTWKGLKYEVKERLGPGDELVVVRPGYYVRERDPTLPREMLVRLVTFVARSTEFRILTSLTDRKIPAEALARIYAYRWEAEMVFDDVKTEQRDASVTLRSKKDDGVLQEIYALLLGHNVVRAELARAARLVQLPPVRLSFHRGLAHVRHFLQFAAATTAPAKLRDRELELRALLAHLVLPPRRTSRWFPRVVKSTVLKYPRKRSDTGTKEA